MHILYNQKGDILVKIVIPTEEIQSISADVDGCLVVEYKETDETIKPQLFISPDVDVTVTLKNVIIDG